MSRQGTAGYRIGVTPSAGRTQPAIVCSIGSACASSRY